MREAVAPHPEPGPCRHCAAPLPAGAAQFCCAGCETAYAIIEGGGWQQYYRVRETAAARPVDADADTAYDYLNSDDYRARHTEADGDTRRADWYLDGLRCGACSWLVEQVCRKHPGVVDAALNFGQARLSLRWREEADTAALAAVLTRLGYRVGLAPSGAPAGPRALLKLGLVGALAGNLMLMSLPFYTGLEEAAAGRIFGGICFLLALPLLLYGARDYYVRAFIAVRRGLPGLDLPIALGLSGAFILSTVNLLRGRYDGLYYDSMGMLVFFLLLGAAAREAGIHRAVAAGRRLLARMPRLVDVLRDGTWVRLPAGDMVPGDLLRLRTGDVVPVDAELLSEGATLNCHVVSGEAHPVTLSRGDRLPTAAVNMGGLIEARAATAYNDSRLARLEETARGLSERRAGAVGASRYAWGFLFFSLSAALTGAWLHWAQSPGAGLTVALTVLIVVCPCALALAQPVAEAFALKAAAAMGAWIKDAEVLRRLPQTTRVVFDKTGILTHGVPRIVARDLSYDNAHWLEAAVAALEAQVNHPLVHAFSQRQGPRLTPGAVRDVQVVPGAGLAGCVDGRRLIVAAPARLAAFDVPAATADAVAARAQALPAHLTLVAVLCNGVPAALYGLEDAVRDEVPDMVARLGAAGLQRTILSGDHDRAVHAVAAQLGITDSHGHMLPEEKLAYLDAHEPAHTVMVGDGFNDMGALARAGVGVTHAHASEAALRFASVIFKDRRMDRLAGLFSIADTARTAVRRGVVVSLLYNSLAVTLALKGVIGPLGAALLMPLSSLSLIALIAAAFHTRRHRWAF